MDTDYEEISITETLSRHRITLEKLCKSKRLHVDEVLEEVVSGESLTARPQMMRLLEMVSTGAYAGVVCMDIERLSRGSSMESGYIMQILQVNGCKIVTPGKIYDLQNESDEQFTDMKFMFSRYELKTITKRLVRGRNQSASEGKFMGSMAPYGYRAYKLPGEKGNSLMVIPEEASVVRMIFGMYGLQGMGYNAIAYRLNDMHIPARKGQWSQTSVANILTNESETDLLRQKSDGNQRKRAAAELIPTTQHILDSYDALTVEEKNGLWKLVIEKGNDLSGARRGSAYSNFPKPPKITNRHRRAIPQI